MRGSPCTPTIEAAPARALTLDCATGAGILPHLDAVARLRMAVFRDWPYLYDGDAG
jgi:hypothetical protein